MQNQTLLFDRSSLNQSSSSSGMMKVSNISHFSREKEKFLFQKSQFEEELQQSSFIMTPPMEKKSIATPNAPIKNKTQSMKVDLKPKKLQYEDEQNVCSNINAGLYIEYDRCSRPKNPLSDKQFANKSNSPEFLKKQIHNLRSRVNKIKIQTNDKENDSSVLQNTLNEGVIQSSSLALSQNDRNANWKEMLEWLLPRRDVGLWIECCRKDCKKFRYCNDYHDPVDVPKIWYCEMNSDKKIARCDIPEVSIPQEIEKDLIENAYNAGSIVWARIIGYPWWPGMVCDSPFTFAYYRLYKKSLQPIKYFVIFLNEDKLEYSWISKNNIKPFVSTNYSQLIKKTKFHGIDYKDSLNKAYTLALNALSLSITERLQKFSFLALHENLNDRKNNIHKSVQENTKDNSSKMNVVESDDEIIPCSPVNRRHMTLKEYYLKIISK